MRYFTKNKSQGLLRRISPVVILGLALVLIIVAFFGDDSYRSLKQMEADLAEQRANNVRVKAHVDSVREQVIGLHKDERTLEKAARNELGMMRPGEVVFIFKDEKEAQ